MSTTSAREEAFLDTLAQDVMCKRWDTPTLPTAPPHVVRELRRTGQIRSRQPVYTIAGQPVINYRVPWVAKGAERKEGLRRLTRDLDGPLGEASGLFWFTHETRYLDQPERVLEAVWQKARNDTWRPLVGAAHTAAPSPRPSRLRACHAHHRRLTGASQGSAPQ